MMRTYAFPILLLLFVLALPSSGHGAYIGVANPSFEADGLDYPGAATGEISGWQIPSDSSAGVWAPTAYAYSYWAFYDQGDNVAFSNGGDFYQYLTTVSANTTYTLDVLIGNRGDYGIPLNLYRVDFLAYDYSTDTSQVIVPTSFQRPVPGPGSWDWARSTFVVPEGSPLIGQLFGIRLWSAWGWGETAGQTNFDLVTLQATQTGSETPIPVNSQPTDPTNPYDPNYNPVYDPTHDDFTQPSVFDPNHPGFDPVIVPPWVVPEPSSLILLCMGLFGFLMFTSRNSSR
jgi:hypothetical protein